MIFYLTHYLYVDLFLRENLFPEASVEDVSSIIGAIKTYASPEKTFDIEIDYKIKIRILKKDDGTDAPTGVCRCLKKT